MGFSSKVITSDKDRENYVLVFSNEDDFQTDMFKFLIAENFFTFDKIAEIKETVEKLKFENNKQYNIYNIPFTVLKDITT